MQSVRWALASRRPVAAGRTAHPGRGRARGRSRHAAPPRRPGTLILYKSRAFISAPTRDVADADAPDPRITRLSDSRQCVPHTLPGRRGRGAGVRNRCARAEALTCVAASSQTHSRRREHGELNGADRAGDGRQSRAPRPHTRHHAIQNTPSSPHCSLCLAARRIPTRRPEPPPQRTLPEAHRSGRRAKTPRQNPLASVGRRGHPHHSASFRLMRERTPCIVDGIIVCIIIAIIIVIIIISHASSSIIIMPAMHPSPRDMSQHPDALARRHCTMPVVLSNARRLCACIGRLSVTLWDLVAPAAVLAGKPN